jgi:cell fate regulator YaaT (PSP1 superfamily)
MVVGLMMRRLKEKFAGDAGHLDLNISDKVIVETEHGTEMAVVFEREKNVDKPKAPVCKVLRKATAEDLSRAAENEKKNEQAHKIILNKILDHELQMKLTCAQYSFDRSKLFIYYTADNRIDFRELIKDLGHMLKTRIQMVQIGVRDEAKMIGGVGHCGRQLCCQEWLKDFSSVTIDMAKEQDIPLNTAKLSGLCGRLMCCLGYEHDFYTKCKKNLPRYGEKVNTPSGPGTVVGAHCLREEVVVELTPDKTGEKVRKSFHISKITK